MDRRAGAERGRGAAAWIGLYAAVHLAMAAYFVFGDAPGTGAARLGFPLDDAWIHLVYARSLSQLQGLHYNPGQPEAGFTSLLWVVVLTPACWLDALFGELWLWVKLTGVAAAVAASALAHRVVARLTGAVFPAAVAGLLLALHPGLAFAQVSGMEVPLALAALLLLFSGLVEGDARRAGLGAALAPLARPELAVVSLIGGLAMLDLLRHRPGELRAWAWTLAPGLLGAGLWIGYCLAVTGRPLPNTFYAKYGAVEDTVPRAMHTIFVELLPASPWGSLGAGLVLTLAGAVWLMGPSRRATSGADPSGADPSGASAPGRPPPSVRLTLAIAGPLLLLTFAQVHDLPQATPFYWQRYVQPALAPLAVLAGLGVHALWTLPPPALTARLAQPWLPWVGRALALTALAAPLPRLARQLPEARDRYAWNCQNIEEMQVVAARWIADHSEPGDVVAVFDAGAIRYHAPRTVLDLNGLNDHQVAGGATQARVNALDPRYYIVFPGAFGLFAGRPDYRPVHRIESPNYTICACDQDVMVIVERLRPPDRGHPGPAPSTTSRSSSDRARSPAPSP